MRVFPMESILINFSHQHFKQRLKKHYYLRPKAKESIRQYVRSPEEKTSLSAIYTFHGKKKSRISF